MGPESRNSPGRGGEFEVGNVDRAIARLAARQHGAVSRRQLIDAGLPTEAIKHRVRAGRLHPIHRGVYLVGHATPMGLAREVAAVLSCGPGTVLSHLSAAVLWGMLPAPRDHAAVDVTVIGRRLATRPGIRIHHTSALHRRDVRPARTLLDLAATVDAVTLERAAANAQAARLTTRRSSLDQLSRNPGRRGSGGLRRLLESHVGPALTRSEAEAAC